MNRKRALCIFAVAAAIAAAGLNAENNMLTLSEYVFESPKVSDSLDGFKIVHLSDLHGKRFGRGNSRLVGLVNAQRPDIILITGDLVDGRHPDPQAAYELVSQLTLIADVYYVTGNHEENLPTLTYNHLLSELLARGVHLLDGRAERFEVGSSEVNIIGMFDKKDFYASQVSELLRPNGFNILLNHRPQFAPDYAAAGIDLSFCGHAHGGQFRIPFVGGLIAPDQLFFPTYSEGIHRFGDRATVISRGLGNSLIPIRINNPPEVVSVTLRKEFR